MTRRVIATGVLLVAFPLLVSALPSTTRAQSGAQVSSSYPIDAIHVTGNTRYSAAQVTRVSGLAPGTSLTIADLDAVVTRMAASGLFTQVGYKYAADATGQRLVVTFEIIEPVWTVPVLFDNFAWFSDAELQAAVAEDVPTFDGTLPQTDGAQALVVASLQRLLKSRDIEGTVEFLTYLHVRTKVHKYLFRVTGAGLPVCAVHLDGVSPDWQTRFAPAVAAQVGRDYSRVSLEGLALKEMEDTYQSRGWLDGTVGTPVVRLNDGCDGVSVTLPVTEGGEYTWERTSWFGTSVLASKDLDRLLNARSGARAETAELDPGLAAVRAAYGKIGHVQAQVTIATHGDPATRRAHLEVRVVEGPQFRMGTLEFVGLSDSDAADLRKRWRLAPGDVFDTSYVAEFGLSHVGPLRQRRRLQVRGPTLNAHMPAHVVSVRYEFRPLGGGF